MELLLRLHHDAGGDGRTTTDVVVRAEPFHTAGELAEALGRRLGLAEAEAPTLRRLPGGEIVDPAASLVDVDLASGEGLSVGGRAPNPTTDDRHDGGESPQDETLLGALIVTFGPDVGRGLRLGGARNQPLTVGRDHRCSLALTDPTASRVQIEVRLDDDGEVLVAPSAEARGAISINGRPLDDAQTVVDDDTITFGSTALTLRSPPTAEGPTITERSLGQDLFHRTPYYPSPAEAHVFDAMGEIPERPEPVRFAYLAALAPLVMGITLAIVYSPRMLVFTAFSPVIAVAGYIEQRRRNRHRYGRGEERYQRKLVERRNEIERALRLEREQRWRSAPDLADLAQRAALRGRELWVRDRHASDFLGLRHGLGEVVPLVTVRPETKGDEDLRDALAAEIDLLVVMPEVPVVVDHAEEAVVGVVGSTDDTTSLVSSLVLQAACLHSPEDLVIVVAVAPERRMGPWLRWLPHTRSASSPLAVDHLAETKTASDQLLAELLTVAEGRVGSTEAGIDRRWPWLLIAIDRELEPDASLVARLLDLCPRAGMSVLWLTGGHDRVPRQAKMTLDCRSPLDFEPSTLTSTDPSVERQALQVERVTTEWADEIARSLAGIRDASSSTAATALPRTVSLQQAFMTDELTAEWIIAQWRHDRGYSLPTTIGLSSAGAFAIDLVEHGPHGLIGGTSGSGKSELVMSLVAGLVACNPPTKVNLLFVDYKGGASSDLFRNLPHTVGYVTNLDALLARRALTSLRAELDRRMDLLKGRAKDLAEMIQRHPHEAPPSLVIVIDEFATLVKEVPEFVAGVVDIAQRGRSLGIHLLLATQRPSGAVNDNILANTNLRISLRMLDGSESTNVIGTNDAARIPTPLKGRAFARIGPGELIAFQAAWSGAPAHPGPSPIEIESFGGPEERLGDGDRWLSAPHERAIDDDGRADTQMDALLQAVLDASQRLGLERGRSPWRDELPPKVALSTIRSPRNDDVDGCEPADGFTVTIGLLDDPERQAQYRANVDFDADGGLILVGTGGSGKTTALRTLAASAALDDSERGGKQLTIIGLDFASRSLGSLSTLPQCAAVAGGDDLEAVTRIIATLNDLLERRRAATAGAAVAGEGGDRFEPVLLLIDDYGNLAQTFEGSGAAADLHPWLETLNRIIVDGRQVGIHTALTASRRAVIKAGVWSACSNRIVLRQADVGGYADLGLATSSVGTVELGPGRGFFNGMNLLQIATLAEGSDPSPTVGLASPQRAEAEALRSLGPTLRGMVSEDLLTHPLPEEIPLLSSSGDATRIPLGRSDMDLSVVELDLGSTNLTILGEPRSGRTTTLLTIGQHLIACGSRVWTFGPTGSGLAGLEGVARSVFGRTADIAQALGELAAGVEAAKATPSTAAPGSPTPSRHPVVLVDDFDLVDDPALDQAMARVFALGLRFVSSTVSLRGYSNNQLAQEMKKARMLLYLQPTHGREVREVTGAPVSIRPGLAMPPGRGVLVVNRQATVVQVARAERG